MKTARVKSRKEQAKKTVGIALSPRFIAEVRKHNLNINRIIEQALTSIVEYPAHGNESKSSKSRNACSLLRENAGPVVQFGMNAAFARRRPRVQIPPGPQIHARDWVVGLFVLRIIER